VLVVYRSNFTATRCERWLGKETGERRPAMESGQPRSNLTKLSETELPLEEPWQDMRGLDVYDNRDEQIGSVEDLYIDREVRLASYLVVSAGGFLGVGEKTFLVPVEEVSRDVGQERAGDDHGAKREGVELALKQPSPKRTS